MATAHGSATSVARRKVAFLLDTHPSEIYSWARHEQVGRCSIEPGRLAWIILQDIITQVRDLLLAHQIPKRVLELGLLDE